VRERKIFPESITGNIIKLLMSCHVALFYAAELGHDILVAELIKKGATVDIVSSAGTTPLFSASQAGYTRTVAVLVEAGASVEPTDESGVNPLMIAAMRLVRAAVLLLIDKVVFSLLYLINVNNIQGEIGSRAETAREAQ
jgi:ankyrin repeat protein